jgi:hypothetical protein
MHPFHERIARVGLAAGAPYGFALAGGYAMQLNGFLERPSEDVDLFTVQSYSAEFDAALTAIMAAYRADGLDVETDRYDPALDPTFARLAVSDDRDISKVELLADWRANHPRHLSIGPVLHPDDAVANKMCALYGRAEARDFVDVDAAIRSGKYSRDRLFALAAAVDHGFDRHMLAGMMTRADVHADSQFAAYGLTGTDLDGLRARFAEWRHELLAA